MKKELLTPILIGRMVEAQDMFALSLYQNFYYGTDLILNVDDYKIQYYELGCGENTLALMTGCYWLEQSAEGMFYPLE